MLLTFILSILTIGFEAMIYFLTHSYNQPWLIVIYLLLLPLCYYLIFGIYIILVFIYSLFINKKKINEKPSEFHYRVLKDTINQLLFLAHVHVHVSGKEKLPKDTPYLFVTNHISNFDPIVAIKVLNDKKLICVTKPENFNIPICGSFIAKCGYIPIDRQNAFNAVKSINRACEVINNNYGNVYICPEGTRSKNQELLEFHPGSFKIAFKSSCPIVVGSIKNSIQIHKNFFYRRTDVYFDIIDVIYPKDFENLSTIDVSKKAYDLIKQNLKK